MKSKRTEKEILAQFIDKLDDEGEKILYCPPVYGICDGKLYVITTAGYGGETYNVRGAMMFVIDIEKDL